MYALQALQFCIVRDSAVLEQQEQFIFDIVIPPFIFLTLVCALFLFAIHFDNRRPERTQNEASLP